MGLTLSREANKPWRIICSEQRNIVECKQSAFASSGLSLELYPDEHDSQEGELI